MNSPAILPIEIYTGESYIQNFYYQDAYENAINIEGYTAKMTGRLTANSSNPAIFSASTSDYITITGALGVISVVLPPSYTSSLSLVSGSWDLFIYGTGGQPAIRLVGGDFNIKESVTK